MRLDRLEPLLVRLDGLLSAASLSVSVRPAVERWRADAAALRFHLRPPGKNAPIIVAVIGGTGTGKSTLVNRLLRTNASATSFRRTYTSGAVAIARAAEDVPEGWLGVEHVVPDADALPARGQAGSLIVIPRTMLPKAQSAELETGDDDLLSRVVIVDTPDLDGDQPAHHAEADRCFRWAQAVTFLVTPEKYQMTELLPYYRLALRYELPTLFVMNKCEEQAVVEDYRGQLKGAGFGGRGEGSGTAELHTDSSDSGGSSAPDKSPSVFAVPRDDAAYEPEPLENLEALRATFSQLSTQLEEARRRQQALRQSSPQTPIGTPDRSGLANRAADLVDRFADQIVGPLRHDRREADRLIASLRGMESPAPGVDVNPLTQELQRRLQQRSVLYLMGPQRVLDRLRQAPGLLVRLPRVAWDYVMRGEISAAALNPGGDSKSREAPDFRAMLIDQFAVVQSRIDDVLRASPAASRWTGSPGSGYEQARLTAEDAGRIADEEIADLRDWLEKRWNATPRDTRMLQTMLKYLPGGKKIAAWTEAAPYLLAVVVLTHHAFFGHIDMLILGGYTIATWVTERLSNEVTSRTRATNARISARFERLAHEQIEKLCAWLDRQAPPTRTLDQLERAAGELALAAGVSGGV